QSCIDHFFGERAGLSGNRELHMKTACPSCKKTYEFASQYTGREFACQDCGTRFRLGDSGASVPTADASGATTSPLAAAHNPANMHPAMPALQQVNYMTANSMANPPTYLGASGFAYFVVAVIAFQLFSIGSNFGSHERYFMMFSGVGGFFLSAATTVPL